MNENVVQAGKLTTPVDPGTYYTGDLVPAASTSPTRATSSS
ncbi:hypothetical protein [Micromonospora maritima]|nr:hypothetical protein [Micromonospora maritima]